MTQTKTFEERVGQYVRLRDMIKEKDDAHKEAMKPFRDTLEQLGGILLTMLNQSGQDAAKTAAGTAYVTVEASATIADPEQFKRHVIGSEDWSLIDWRANKTAVKAFVEENQAAPPGVNFTTIRKVGVRRPGAKE